MIYSSFNSNNCCHNYWLKSWGIHIPPTKVRECLYPWEFASNGWYHLFKTFANLTCEKTGISLFFQFSILGQGQRRKFQAKRRMPENLKFLVAWPGTSFSTWPWFQIYIPPYRAEKVGNNQCFLNGVSFQLNRIMSTVITRKGYQLTSLKRKRCVYWLK